MTGQRGTIVVAEDDPAIRELLSQLLREEFDAEVRLVGDGAAALEAVRQEGVLAIVLDIGLPKMDGMAVTAAMQADPRLRAIPIVAVTATVPWHREAMLAAGCQAFLAKPFQIEVLVEVLRRLIPVA
jgi:CheY-like chemotaxis protein